MDKILNRWAKTLRSILRIPEMEQDIAQLKVLLEEQELRTASMLALLANQQQQLGEQLGGLRQLFTQRSFAATADGACGNEQLRKLAASLDGLASEIKKCSGVLDGPVGSQRVQQQNDDNQL